MLLRDAFGYSTAGSLTKLDPVPRVPLARSWVCAIFALLFAAFGGAAVAAGAQTDGVDEELEQLLEEERQEADRLRRRGDLDGARRILEELLAEEPADHRTRSLLARVELDGSRFDAADQAARAALGGPPEARREAALVLLLGAAERAGAARGAAVLSDLASARVDFDADAELLQARGALQLALGARTLANEDFQRAADGPAADWRSLLARARAKRALSDLVGASRDLVEAERASRAGGGEPDVLAELASLYFEADGEVADGRTAQRAPGPIYRRALSLNPSHEAAGLGMFALGVFNWRRQSASPESYLEPVFAHRPLSVGAFLARTSAQLDDGQLPAVRAGLAQLERIAPERREVRALAAALAWVEHRREEAERSLGALIERDPADSGPERTVGVHLVELYRFAEGRQFLERAVERNPKDHQAWTELGRARANTGDVVGGLAALRRAEDAAGGRQNAWRSNQRMVLERMERLFVEHRAGSLTFAWMPDEGPVLARYMAPFYEQSQKELEQRYGIPSGPVRIEVYRRHGDFSVRSTGFEGFPAVGVCFGPVVTAVSPLAEIRGQFSWARTGYHEFTHVVHLALSNNRCPRWITEGLATWEEERKHPAWTRNMRQDLLDARAHGDLIPLRELNRAFRGPRILFGYYQGGLLCKMLIESHGFPSMVRLLEAFDRGLDLDAAMGQVFGLTPEAIDRRFAEFVDRELAGIFIEPRWRDDRLTALRLTLERRPPEALAERAAWRSRWVDVAFGAFGAGRRVDAEDALRLAESGLSGGADRVPARVAHLRGVMALARGDRDAAREQFQGFLGAGGEDFRVRMALADMAMASAQPELAREHYTRAEAAFPGFPERQLAAELGLARLLEAEGDREGAAQARLRWLAYNADAGDLLLEVARWAAGAKQFALAAELFGQANEIDPFQRALHIEWGEALLALGRGEEALREFEVAQLVPPELEPGPAEALTEGERAHLEGLAAQCLVLLGRTEEARARAEAALLRAPETESAKLALERIP